MKRIIEFPLESGDTILVEVEEASTPETRLRGISPTEVAEKARQTLEVALDNIKPAVAAVITRLRELSDTPEQIGIEFGIKLSSQAGAVIASASVEANFKVTLSWSRKREATKP